MRRRRARSPGPIRRRSDYGSTKRDVSRAATPKKARGTAGRAPDPTSLHGWRTRKEAALAKLRELEFARREGRVLDAAAVQREWEDVLRTVRAGVLAVVSRVRARCPHLTAADVQVIDEELRAALTALGGGAAGGGAAGG
jgi:phage terminase Nu1 subunit (DNA packaging protein)